MDNQNSQKKVKINQFDRMWLDSLLSLTPNTMYNEAWNMEKVSDTQEGYGLTFQQSNELFVNLPGVVRGLLYIEDRDYYIVFVDTDSGGEIGIIRENEKSYEKVVDSKIYPEIGISQDQWVDCTAKIVRPCNHLYLYFSTNDVYKRINIDDPCEEYEEIQLINPVCVATLETSIVEKGGGLPNGIYQFFAKARDKEGNDSNWSKISNVVSISDGDHKAGSISNEAINLKVTGLNNPDYHIVDLGVLTTINGVVTVEEFTSVSTSNESGSIDYLYTGKTGREKQMNISDVLTRTNRYIRGKNLVQYENRLVLYNLRPIHNLDYQRLANEIEVGYDTYLVPLEKAEYFKSLLRNENYMPAIRWNYNDGTSSHGFPVIVDGDCQGDCEEYRDNSVRTEVHIDLDDIGVKKEISVAKETDYTDVPLGQDERPSVDLGKDDVPTVGSELGEFDKMDFEMKEMLDCICEKAKVLAGEEGPNIPIFGDNWDLDDDLEGAISLGQLMCMCENREFLSGEGGETDGEVSG